MLETIIVEPVNTATHAVIWLHGLGADGHDFVPVVPEIQPSSENIRFIFPHAPIRPVGLFGGMPTRAWFDLFMRGSTFGFVEAEVIAMAQLIDGLVREQIAKGIPAYRILLGGFSQGGAMASYAALTSPHQLGGLIGLSTFLPPVDSLATQARMRFPVFVGHGTEDDVVAFDRGIALSDSLKNAGFDVSWHSYPIAHSVSSKELADIKAWLAKFFY